MKKKLGAALLATMILVLPSITFAQTSSTQETLNNSLRAVIALLIQEVRQLENELAQAPHILATSTYYQYVPPTSSDNGVNNLLGGVPAPTSTAVVWESLIQGEQVVLSSSTLFLWYEGKQHVQIDDATFIVNGDTFSIPVNEIGPAVNGNWYYIASTSLTVSDLGLVSGQTYLYTKHIDAGDVFAEETGTFIAQ